MSEVLCQNGPCVSAQACVQHSQRQTEPDTHSESWESAAYFQLIPTIEDRVFTFHLSVQNTSAYFACKKN